MGTEETPRQKLFALCWRGGPGALDKVKELIDSKEVSSSGILFLSDPFFESAYRKSGSGSWVGVSL